MLLHRLLLAAVVTSGAIVAAPITFLVSLNGANESPANASPGIGTAVIVIDSMAHTLQVDVSFSGLTFGTSAAHIHCCTAAPGTGNVGVATVLPNFTGFPLGVMSGTYSRLYDMTLTLSYNAAFITAHGGTAAQAEADLFAGIAAGSAYLNIHTTAFPGGEIRGFLAPVPEPGTLLTLGAGLAGLAMIRRRRQSLN